MGMRYKPSKPAAIVSCVVGAGMLVFGIVQLIDADDAKVRAFVGFWCISLVAILGLNVWAAFSERGSLGTFVGGGPSAGNPGAGADTNGGGSGDGGQP